ncbi:BRO family protein [Moraxella sp. ZY200743]|uniref:BRO family protein n=1 Tax=Moraxella sp. ZY200743 TaxID=2911970 RepID=UPI003D7D9310
MQLTFNQINFQPINKANQIWLTTSQLAEALEYSDVRGITNIYNRKADEFSDGMTALIDNPQMKNAKIRIFSLRGCHLIAMFARTKVAKQFRQWVLDILDKEVGEPVQVEPKISPAERYQIQKAVKQKCLNNKVHYQTIYNALYDAFGVASYKDLLASEFDNAMAFIESFSFTPAENQALYEVLADNAMHLRDYLKMLKVLKGLPIVSDSMGRNTFEQVVDSYNAIIALANQLGLTNRYNQPMFGHNCINFYHGNALITR